MSPIRDYLSSEISMLTVGGNRNVHTPPSSHFSSWSLHSISVVRIVSAAGLTIAWQRSSRKMVLWRQLRATYPKRRHPLESQQLFSSLHYAGLQLQMGFDFWYSYWAMYLHLYFYFNSQLIGKIRSYCNFTQNTHAVSISSYTAKIWHNSHTFVQKNVSIIDLSFMLVV